MLVRTVSGVGGGFDSLYKGPISEAPYDIVMAVNSSLTVLSWFENLPKDEQPPRWIWWSGELLDDWFTEVRERRDSRSHGGRKRSSWDDGEDVPLSDNDLATEMREAMRGR